MGIENDRAKWLFACVKESEQWINNVLCVIDHLSAENNIITLMANYVVVIVGKRKGVMFAVTIEMVCLSILIKQQ